MIEVGNATKEPPLATVPMTTELVVVRHGQTEFNRRGLYQGHADSALTDVGRAQATNAAGWRGS